MDCCVQAQRRAIEYFATTPGRQWCSPTSRWRRKNVPTDAGVFVCWEFNWDQENVEYIESTGFAGSLTTIWRYKQPDIADPPTSNYGLQVSFTQQGFLTPNVVFNEVQFIPASSHVFYALLLSNTIRNDLKEDNPIYNTSLYTGYNYQFSIASPAISNGSVYSGLSFGYQDLGKQVITYTPSYSIDNLFGDFAGMLALLTGLNLIKVAASVAIGCFCWSMRDFTPFVIHYSK